MQAVGEDQPRARARRSSPSTCKAAGLLDVSRRARLQPRRLRLHDLHRQQRSAARRRCRQIVKDKNLVVASVLSGNRNFEGRIQQQVRANYLASPPLVVAYALAGRMTIDLTTEPLGIGHATAQPVYLQGHLADRARDSGDDAAARCSSEMFREQYARRVRRRRALASRCRCRPASASRGTDDSTYIRNPPFFEGLTLEPAPLARHRRRARARAARRQRHDRSHLAGRIDQGGQPGREVPDRARASQPADFNSYGARRGNHEVMMRGTFANIRLRNQLAPGTEGGWTTLPARRRGDDDLRRVDEVPATPACRC